MIDLVQIAITSHEDPEQRRGRVLEVGYGLGISSRAIQVEGVHEHVIVEMNIDVMSMLLASDLARAPGVRPLLGLWQDVVPMLADASFDSIFFDPFPNVRCGRAEFTPCLLDRAASLCTGLATPFLGCWLCPLALLRHDSSMRCFHHALVPPSVPPHLVPSLLPCSHRTLMSRLGTRGASTSEISCGMPFGCSALAVSSRS